jgi:MerR family transcriptional regulator, mercuric resistance operon regulatory protein
VRSQKLAYRRGELAKMSGVNLETVRYYEDIGLLLELQRSPAGHRLYSESDLKRLIFVKRSRELGYATDEVRNVLDLVDNQTYSCDQMRELTLEHLKDVQAKIKDLRKVAKSLKDMASQCEGAKTPVCHVIDVLHE